METALIRFQRVEDVAGFSTSRDQSSGSTTIPEPPRQTPSPVRPLHEGQSLRRWSRVEARGGEGPSARRRHDNDPDPREDR